MPQARSARPRRGHHIGSLKIRPRDPAAMRFAFPCRHVTHCTPRRHKLRRGQGALGACQRKVRVPSDQELFAKGLATYQKVVALNYMAHREVYGLLHQVLAAEAPDQFVFADLACGPAMTSAEALRDTRIGRYIGIDSRSHPLMSPVNRSGPWPVRWIFAVKTSSRRSTPGTSRSMLSGSASLFIISEPPRSGPSRGASMPSFPPMGCF